MPLISRRMILASTAMLAGAMRAPAIRAQALSIADIALLDGPERAQRLAEGARREGSVTFYSSMQVEDIQVLAAAFEQRTGVALRTWRGSSEGLVQRAINEYRGGRFEADVYETNGIELEALYRERLLQEVRTPVLGDLIPGAVLPHRQYVGTRVNVYSLLFNTNLVRREELPARWEDFTDPRWRGRLGIEADNDDWFATMIREMGEERALRVFRQIVATNGVSARRGHTLLSNLVVSGEVPMALTIYQYRAEQLKASGAPVDYIYLPPTPARINGMGVSNRSRRPHAAILFYDFMLTEAQRILAERSFMSTNRAYDRLPRDVRLSIIDSGAVLNESQRWQTLFRDVFLRQQAR